MSKSGSSEWVQIVQHLSSHGMALRNSISPDQPSMLGCRCPPQPAALSLLCQRAPVPLAWERMERMKRWRDGDAVLETRGEAGDDTSNYVHLRGQYSTICNCTIWPLAVYARVCTACAIPMLDAFVILGTSLCQLLRTAGFKSGLLAKTTTTTFIQSSEMLSSINPWISRRTCCQRPFLLQPPAFERNYIFKWNHACRDGEMNADHRHGLFYLNTRSVLIWWVQSLWISLST